MVSQLFNRSCVKILNGNLIFLVALDEGGVHAKVIWGKQFVKILQLIYEGVQGEQKARFGGSEVLAQASRARCQLEVEKIMS